MTYKLPLNADGGLDYQEIVRSIFEQWPLAGEREYADMVIAAIEAHTIERCAAQIHVVGHRGTIAEYKQAIRKLKGGDNGQAD